MRITHFLLSLSLLFATSTAALADDIPTRVWRAPGPRPPRFALLCIHGLGLNSNSYADFAKRVMRHGGIVFAIDVRGFGKWQQTPDNKMDFDGCLADIKKTLQDIHAQAPNLPVFLLGESMGGAIALRATSMYPELIDGLISSVPAAERFQSKKTDLKVALQMLRGPNHQSEKIGKQVMKQAATAEIPKDGKDEKVVNTKLEKAWEGDPLNRLDLSPKDLVQFQAFMNDNHDAVKKITNTPVLFVQGLDDQLVKPEGTFELVQEIQTPYRMFVAFPTRHLVFEETEAANPKINRASTQVVLAWIASHIIDPEGPLGSN